MPRSLVLGNGAMLVGFDSRGQVRDFYFPYVGLENHVGTGAVHRIGVWADGVFGWFDDADWEVEVGYQNETLGSDIRAKNKKLGLEICFLDIVYNEKNIFLRNVSVKSGFAGRRNIKVFLGQEFHIYEMKHGDTAYYDPELRAIVHYKGRRVFITSGLCDHGSFDDFSVGIFGIEGREGTWKDAEDGLLSRNPIEHGSVDSVMGFSFELEKNASGSFVYWVAAAETFPEAQKLQEYLIKNSPAHITETTQDFWRAWVNKLNFTFFGLDETISGLFKKSLLIARTHLSKGGAIVASGDSDMLQYGRDTYSYMWPRDASFTALALDKAGYFDVTRSFFDFCNDVIEGDGYLLHKYRPDRSRGSSWHPWVWEGKRQLAIQEDETALVIFALWEHYAAGKDLEFVEKIYNSLIKRAADFMCGYRDPKTKLPFGSYDLWEERFGASTFTSSAVYGAIRAAGSFAALLGKENEAKRYDGAAEEMRRAIVSRLWNEKASFFYRLVDLREDPPAYDETLDASSFYGPFRFGVLEPDDKRLVSAFHKAKDRLFCKTDVGGVVRYEGDRYRRVWEDTPGNPWFVTTMWFTQYLIARAKREADLEEVRKSLRWISDRALSSGVLSEQIDPKSGGQISASPLTWSHAEFVSTVVMYLEKLESLGACKTCRPLKG